ncbi:bidirectional sugar transporter SWEET2-like [Cicer arietinum]|uniref:bidirectional sugar transporter SWEET2-like n=1 Tax=Cicer arietinum TaxID=3827 RepID=UPI003CC6080B
MRKFDLSISGIEAIPLLCVGKDATGIAGTYSFSMCHGYFYHMDAAGIADTFSFPNENYHKWVKINVFKIAIYLFSIELHVVWDTFISPNNVLVTTVNSIGAAFQFVYIVLFLVYAEKARKVRMFGLLLAVLGICGIILVGSLKITYSSMRRMFVGFLSCASLISMFASPLFIIKLVIRTKSLEFMPFCLSLSTFLISASFLLYGLLSDDAFFYVPNEIGTVLAIIQLVLCLISSNESRDTLIMSCG